MNGRGAAKGEYILPKSRNQSLPLQELIEHWKQLVRQISDHIRLKMRLDEEDWEGWQQLTKELGDTSTA